MVLVALFGVTLVLCSDVPLSVSVDSAVIDVFTPVVPHASVIVVVSVTALPYVVLLAAADVCHSVCSVAAAWWKFHVLNVILLFLCSHSFHRLSAAAHLLRMLLLHL